MSFCLAFFNQNTLSQTMAADKSALDKLLDSIRFNLQALLKSEAPMVVLDPRLSQIHNSNWRYGVVDIQSSNRFMDPEGFATQLEKAIAYGEPRLSQVKIEVLEHPDAPQQCHFQLHGNIDPLLIELYCLNHKTTNYHPIAYQPEPLAISLDIALNDLTIEEAGYDH